MSVFRDVTLGFEGKEYTIPSNKIMMLIAKVEDVVSLGDLTTGMGPKLSRLAEAYCVCLKYAGADVKIEEVYETLFGDGGRKNVEGAITNLMTLMLPPSSYQPDTEKTGKPPAAE